MSVTVDNAFSAHEIVTEFLKTLINKGASPNQIMIGIHNVFYHGEILEQNGYSPLEDDDLGAFYDSLFVTSKAMMKLCGQED